MKKSKKLLGKLTYFILSKLYLSSGIRKLEREDCKL